jgi:hypothetical protein
MSTRTEGDAELPVAKNLQTVARRALTPCAGSDAFRFADGGTVRDLNELRHAVATKSTSLVHFHREHYHHWVHDVLGDPALARKVERLAQRRTLDNATYQRELVEILDERLGKLRLRVL